MSNARNLARLVVGSSGDIAAASLGNLSITPTAISDQANSSTGYLALPVGTTGQRPETPANGMSRFNSTLGIVEVYDTTGWTPIAAPPTITGVSPSSVDESASGDQTFVISGDKFDAGAVGYVTSNGTQKTPTTSTRNSSTQITIVYSGADVFTVAADASVSVSVQNGNGLSSAAFSLSVDATPVWVTAAGSLGTFVEDEAISTVTFQATDPEGQNVSYAVTSGSIPTGLSLSSGGLLTGTVNADGAYSASGVVHNFSIGASDGTGNTTTRAFSILRKWRDGSSSSLAAASAAAIKATIGSTPTNGTYYINVGGTPQLVYCDFGTYTGDPTASWMLYQTFGSSPQISTSVISGSAITTSNWQSYGWGINSNANTTFADHIEFYSGSDPIGTIYKDDFSDTTGMGVNKIAVRYRHKYNQSYAAVWVNGQLSGTLSGGNSGVYTGAFNPTGATERLKVGEYGGVSIAAMDWIMVGS